MTHAAWMIAAIAIAQPTTKPQVSAEAFSPLPLDESDLEERLIGRFELAGDPVFTSLSGSPNPLGVTTPSLRTANEYLRGTLAAGTQGIFLPTLNSYFLGAGAFDLQGGPPITSSDNLPSGAPSAQPSIVDRYSNGRAFFLHSVYGELDGLTKEGAASHLFIRAGRQFHYGQVGVTFDGATAGYDDHQYKIEARVGRRAGIFERDQSNPGIVAGGSASGRIDFGDANELLLEAEYTHYQRYLTLGPKDQLYLTDGVPKITQHTDLWDFGTTYDFENARVYARASALAPELSHIRAGGHWIGGPVVVLLDFDEKVGRDLFYSLSGGSGVVIGDVHSTYETYRLNIPDLRPYTQIDATVDVQLADWLSLEVMPGFRLVHADASVRTPFDVNRYSIAAGANGAFRLDAESGLEANLGYTAILYSNTTTNGVLVFRDLNSEDVAHEISAGVRYTRGERFVRGRLLAGQSLSTGLGAFFRLTRFSSPLITPLNEGLFGARADVRWTFTRYASLRVLYEVAQDSNLFLPELGLFHHIQVAMEARF